MNEKPRAPLKVKITLLLTGIALVGIGAAVGYRYRTERTTNAPPSTQSMVEALIKKGRGVDAERVKAACPPTSGSVCRCAEAAAPIALDQDLGSQALELLNAAIRSCNETPGLRAMHAEALARTNLPDEALVETAVVLSKTAQDPYAHYAKAQIEFTKGDLALARGEAAQAVQGGRGAPAHLLLGLIAYRNNDFPGALAEFDTSLQTDPSSVSGNFNRGFVLHRMNRYHDAREAYLKVTQLDPTNLDARFNLGLLAHSIGANDEARHHLQKLKELAPADERTTQLSRILDATSQGNAAPANSPGSSGK